VLPLVDESIRGAAVPPLPERLEQSVRAVDVASGTRSLAFFTRMVFSALVDADRLATAGFYAQAEGRTPDHDRLKHEPLAVLRERLDAFIDRKGANADPTPINRLRADVLAACRGAAIRPPGLFSLTVPTGGGKTLSGMSFSLRHATEHRLDRVIVVIPYTSGPCPGSEGPSLIESAARHGENRSRCFRREIPNNRNGRGS
jgi:CRISPR-associated endonuclease/helicase Cas3